MIYVVIAYEDEQSEIEVITAVTSKSKAMAEKRHLLGDMLKVIIYVFKNGVKVKEI